MTTRRKTERPSNAQKFVKGGELWTHGPSTTPVPKNEWPKYDLSDNEKAYWISLLEKPPESYLPANLNVLGTELKTLAKILKGEWFPRKVGRPMLTKHGISERWFEAMRLRQAVNDRAEQLKAAGVHAAKSAAKQEIANEEGIEVDALEKRIAFSRK